MTEKRVHGKRSAVAVLLQTGRRCCAACTVTRQTISGLCKCCVCRLPLVTRVGLEKRDLCVFSGHYKVRINTYFPYPPPTRMTLPLADTRKCDIQGNVNCVQSQTDSEFPYVKTAPHIKCYYPM